MIRRLTNSTAISCALISYVAVPTLGFLSGYLIALSNNKPDDALILGVMMSATLLAISATCIGITIRDHPEERAEVLDYLRRGRQLYNRLNRFSFFRDPINEMPIEEQRQINVRMGI